ncbi:MAG: nuclear transport factor 2 family protein [Gammaproteobacteria bacterium]|nr:nuclear transport factor 2 family protein [Gammaproteobacteria bacterium]
MDPADIDTDAMPANARTALRFLQRFWASDAAGATGLCTPDARFVFARSLPYDRESPVAEAITRISDDMFTSFDPEGFSIDVHSIIAEGDEVAAEYTATGRTRDGRVYENDYVMKFTLRDGSIARIRPYTDTLHLTRILGG